MLVQVTGGSTIDYVAFNRKTGMNDGTRDGEDKVVITQTGGRWPSTLVAKLTKGDQYVTPKYGRSGNDIIIAVKKMSLNLTQALAHISITNVAPTQSPTNLSTKSPTTSPTKFPSTSPTESQSRANNRSPT